MIPVDLPAGPDPASLVPQLATVVDRTELPFPVRRGKVRAIYDLGDRLLFVATDRLTGLDRFLTLIPAKGAVLTGISRWWFERTGSLVPNHYLGCPHPNATLVRKCRMLPVEFVVRAYLTGSTSTAVWTHYQQGARIYCGNRLPEGLRKNDPLPEPILTPTTKSEEHDEPIAPDQIIARSLLTPDEWEQASAAALTLFRAGQATAAERGMILVDTKYEFGVSSDGAVLVADEVHTPDSSRYWIASSYPERHAAGAEPESIDKEFIRLWYRDHCDPYHDPELPEAPSALRLELAARYLRLYQILTGEALPLPKQGEHPQQSLSAVLASLS